MIKDYIEFSLSTGGDEYLSKEDIQKFEKEYIDFHLPKKERTEKFELLEEEFYNYFISLTDEEVISFMEEVKKVILKKDYMNAYDKAYKIFDVNFRLLFGFVSENRYKNIDLLKSYFKKLFSEILSIHSDNYLLEKNDFICKI